jgi:hypothetical protein|tara:strand:- start:23 stop:130 length:108 start_codon:yes stop_codon:yes gene_type:complete
MIKKIYRPKEYNVKKMEILFKKIKEKDKNGKPDIR